MSDDEFEADPKLNKFDSDGEEYPPTKKATIDDSDDYKLDNDDYKPQKTKSVSAPHKAQQDEESNRKETVHLIPGIAGPKFEVIVTNPAKQGDGMSAFITYTIITKTNFPQYSQSDMSEFSVVRRYKDFLWLYEELQANFKGIIIPPIPEKNALGRFQTEFVEQRRGELEKFLNRVAKHATLQASASLQTFLEAPDEVFVAARVKPTDWGKIVKDVGRSISNFATDTAIEQSQENIWFEKKKGYIYGMETQYGNFAKTCSNLSQKRLELATSYIDVMTSAQLLSEVGLDVNLASALTKVGKTAERINAVMQEQASQETILANTSKDYQRMAASAKDVMSNRTQAQGNYSHAVKAMELKKDRHSKLVQQPGKENKALSLEAEIADSESKVESAKSEFENLNGTLQLEMAEYDNDQRRDVRKAILAFVDAQINAHKKALELWQNVFPELSSALDSIRVANNDDE